MWMFSLSYCENPLRLLSREMFSLTNATKVFSSARIRLIVWILLSDEWGISPFPKSDSMNLIFTHLLINFIIIKLLRKQVLVHFSSLLYELSLIYIFLFFTAPQIKPRKQLPGIFPLSTKVTCCSAEFLTSVRLMNNPSAYRKNGFVHFPPRCPSSTGGRDELWLEEDGGTSQLHWFHAVLLSTSALINHDNNVFLLFWPLPHKSSQVCGGWRRLLGVSLLR